jgi:hypothetical protein
MLCVSEVEGCGGISRERELPFYTPKHVNLAVALRAAQISIQSIYLYNSQGMVIFDWQTPTAESFLLKVLCLRVFEYAAGLQVIVVLMNGNSRYGS